MPPDPSTHLGDPTRFRHCEESIKSNLTLSTITHREWEIFSSSHTRGEWRETQLRLYLHLMAAIANAEYHRLKCRISQDCGCLIENHNRFNWAERVLFLWLYRRQFFGQVAAVPILGIGVLFAFVLTADWWTDVYAWAPCVYTSTEIYNAYLYPFTTRKGFGALVGFDIFMW